MTPTMTQETADVHVAPPIPNKQPIKRKRGRPRKVVLDTAVAKEEASSRPKGRGKPPRVIPDPAAMAELQSKPKVDNGWVDHSNVTLTVMKAEIPWAVSKMMNVSRGLTRQRFIEKAKKTLDIYYPQLRKSAAHVMFTPEKGKAAGPVFVEIPVPCKLQIEQVIRFCDLIETMVTDGAFP